MTQANFDNGLEGWTVEGDGSITWHDVGGDPGGYLSFAFPTASAGQALLQPGIAFVGDHSAAFGGVFSYRIMSSAENTHDTVGLYLEGAGHTLYADGFAPARSRWTAESVRLDDNHRWTDTATGEVPTRAVFKEVLANLDHVFIPVSYTGTPGSTGLDDVFFGPQPQHPPATLHPGFSWLAKHDIHLPLEAPLHAVEHLAIA